MDFIKKMEKDLNEEITRLERKKGKPDRELIRSLQFLLGQVYVVLNVRAGGSNV